MYINKVQNIPKSQEQWIENYHFLEVANWTKIYKLPFKICRDTYIQTLQYIFLHRVLDCNYNLYLQKIKDNSMCEICKLVDSIEHYLFHCKKNINSAKVLKNV